MERQLQTRTRRSFFGAGIATVLAACARSVDASLPRRESIANLRRVVTGKNRAGKAVAVHNGVAPRVVQFPGTSTRAFNQHSFRKEYLAKAPGLAESMELQDSGMHTTESVDYGVVISGEITLELDDGATVELKQGDCVVQNGTRHAWRNRSAKPCIMAFVLVGAILPNTRGPGSSTDQPAHQ